MAQGRFKRCEFDCIRKHYRPVRREMLTPAAQARYPNALYLACQKHWTRVYRYGDPTQRYDKSKITREITGK